MNLIIVVHIAHRKRTTFSIPNFSLYRTPFCLRVVVQHAAHVQLDKSSWPLKILLVCRLGKGSVTPEIQTLPATNHTPYGSRYTVEHFFNTFCAMHKDSRIAIFKATLDTQGEIPTLQTVWVRCRSTSSIFGVELSGLQETLHDGNGRPGTQGHHHHHPQCTSFSLDGHPSKYWAGPTLLN